VEELDEISGLSGGEGVLSQKVQRNRASLLGVEN
jgi:hypothetical protein